MQHSYVRKGLELLNEQKFTRLCMISYQPDERDAVPRKWEMMQRTTRTIPFDAFKQTPTPLALDAVEICATVRKAAERYLILVAQYRPPLDSVVLEFPAGLIDAGEDPKKAAVRELFEETGYVASESDVVSVSPPICPEPGLSDTCCQFVRINVDGDRAENATPKQHLDVGEDIEVILLALCSDGSTLEALTKIAKDRSDAGTRTILDAKLYTFLEALSLARADC